MASFARKFRRRTLGDEVDELVAAAKRLRAEPHALGDMFDAESMVDGKLAARATIMSWEVMLSSRACSRTVHWHLVASPVAGSEVDQYERWARLDQLKEFVLRHTRSDGRVGRIFVPGRGRAIHLYWHEAPLRRKCDLLQATRRLLKADHR